MVKTPLKAKLALVGALLGLTLVSCNSTSGSSGGDSTVRDFDGKQVDEWWNNPKDLPYDLCVVGSSPVLGNPSAARTSAENNARAQMAAMKKAKVQQLIEDWAQQTGDMLQEGSLQSLINNEQFTRSVVDEDVSGARAIAYTVRDYGGVQTQFVLMTLEDTTLFFDNMKMAIEENILADETYLRTEVRKEDARMRLEQLLEEDRMEVLERQEARGQQ